MEDYNPPYGIHQQGKNEDVDHFVWTRYATIPRDRSPELEFHHLNYEVLVILYFILPPGPHLSPQEYDSPLLLARKGKEREGIAGGLNFMANVGNWSPAYGL
jgi:hypothetical protein